MTALMWLSLGTVAIFALALALGHMLDRLEELDWADYVAEWERVDDDD